MRSVLRTGIIMHDLYHYVELADGSYFVNHSEQPNTRMAYPEPDKYRQELGIVAIRPIKKGEEISESYASYLPRKAEWLVPLLEKHCADLMVFVDELQKKYSEGQQS